MGIFTSWFRAKWQHPDPEVRLAAVQGMDASEVDRLAGIALRDGEPRVRAAAAGKIADPGVLADLAERGDDAVRRIARERLSGSADRLLRTGKWAQAGRFLANVGDAKSLVDLSLHAADGEIRRQAFAKLLASAGGGSLETVAVQDAGGELGVQVVDRLDRRQLKDVARKAKAERVRAAAAARLARLDAEERKPSHESRRQERLKALEPLVERALRVAVSTDWAKAGQDLERLESELAAVHGRYADLPADPAADHLAARITRAIREFNARRGEAEAAAQAEADRARAARQALIDQARLATLDAAGAQELARRWRELPPLADAGALDGEFAALIAPTLGAPADAALPAPAGAAQPLPELPAELIARLDALAAQAEALIAARDRRDAKFRFQVLHKELDGLGKGAVAHHPTFRAARDRFTAAFIAFKEHGRAERQAREESRGRQAVRAGQLIAEAERLAAAPVAEGAPQAEVAARVDALKRLGADFRAALAGLRPDQAAPLRERLRPALDAAWAPLKSFQEAEDWERFQHLAKAEEAIGAVEALAAVEDPNLILRGLKQAQAAWKTAGPLPRAKAKPTWDRFKAALDAQYARLQPWFASQDAARIENLAAKMAIIEEAESLASAAGKTVGLPGSPADLQAKQQAVQRMKALQESWKAIGPVPRERDDEVWGRWRQAGDAFWKQHKADLAVRDQHQDENRKRKEALIAQATQLADTAERAKATGLVTSADIIRRLKDLQLQWRGIGHVPRDQVEPLWQQWKAALDRCWATVKDHTDAIAQERAANKAKKEAIIAEAEAIAGNENARWFKEDVRGLIKQWRDVGPVERDDADALELRFRTVCDKVLKAE